MSKITKFLRSGRDEKVLLITAAWSLLRGRILLACTPTNKIISDAAKNLGSHSTIDVDGERIAKIAWAINAASANVPWRSDCFVRSLGALYLLRKIGIIPTFHLGIRRDDVGEMVAHAWVTIGNYAVTDPIIPESYSCFNRLQQ